MRFMTAHCTDVGLKKQTNQDSMLIQTASSKKYGEIAFAIVCDGMGGLEKGELASAVLIRAMADWFRSELPQLLDQGFAPERLKEQWEAVIHEQDRKISGYGYQNHLRMGTTITALLIIGQSYYIANVGDSRIYLLTDQIFQLTKDHTVVQMEMDQGRLSPEQAAVDPRRSVLLQCVGASEGVVPDFFTGNTAPKQVFMLCCDGFRHVIKPSEFYQSLNYRGLKNEKVMQEKLRELIELNKQRGETDNISAILVRVD